MRPLFLLVAVFASPAIARVPPPPVNPPVPHIDVIDVAKAEAVYTALANALAAQGLPLDSGAQGYDLPDLACQNLWAPHAVDGYGCSFHYAIGESGDDQAVTITGPSALAEVLFSSLGGAGANPYIDAAHGSYLVLKHLVVKSTELHFDDLSNYHPAPVPNVAVTGAAAQRVLTALTDAGIDDADGSLLLICTTFATLTCSYQLHQSAGQAVGSDQATELWAAVKRAAELAGFVPTNGTIDQMTVFNASDFSFDGTTLGFVLVGDDALPPPPAEREAFAAPR